jgi:hypothetical protein
MRAAESCCSSAGVLDLLGQQGVFGAMPCVPLTEDVSAFRCLDVPVPHGALLLLTCTWSAGGCWETS